MWKRHQTCRLQDFLHGPQILVLNLLIETLAYRSLEAIWLCPKKSRMVTTSAPCSRRFEERYAASYDNSQ